MLQHPFVVDALRRLIAYRRIRSRASGESHSTEYIHLLDLLLAGDRESAAAFLRQHPMKAMSRKTPGLS